MVGREDITDLSWDCNLTSQIDHVAPTGYLHTITGHPCMIRYNGAASRRSKNPKRWTSPEISTSCMQPNHPTCSPPSSAILPAHREMHNIAALPSYQPLRDVSLSWRAKSEACHVLPALLLPSNVERRRDCKRCVTSGVNLSLAESVFPLLFFVACLPRARNVAELWARRGRVVKDM